MIIYHFVIINEYPSVKNCKCNSKNNYCHNYVIQWNVFLEMVLDYCYESVLNFIHKIKITSLYLLLFIYLMNKMELKLKEKTPQKTSKNPTFSISKFAKNDKCVRTLAHI